MTKDRSWMYGSIESSEFIDGVLEFVVLRLNIKLGRGELVFIAHVSIVAMYQR